MFVFRAVRNSTKITKVQLHRFYTLSFYSKLIFVESRSLLNNMYELNPDVL